MTYETGVVKAHPISIMAREVMRIWRTWMHCRAHGYPCNQWYGVYEAGSEVVLVNCGPLPGALSRADEITATLNKVAPDKEVVAQ